MRLKRNTKMLLGLGALAGAGAWWYFEGRWAVVPGVSYANMMAMVPEGTPIRVSAKGVMLPRLSDAYKDIMNPTHPRQGLV